MVCYILFGPGDKDPKHILQSYPNIEFNLLDKLDVKKLRQLILQERNIIVVTQYIYPIPKDILYRSQLIYCASYKSFDISNKEIIKFYYSKYDYIKTFISSH